MTSNTAEETSTVEREPDVDRISSTKRDLEQIWRWNADIIPTVARCVHDIFAETVQEHAESPAICAWDGELSYAELDQQSTCLARYLVSQGVQPGMVVALCFEKSKWMPVTVLGLMKAGGASMAMDVMQPEQRLKDIVGQLDTRLILSSVANEPLARRLADSPRPESESTIVVIPEIILSQSIIGPQPRSLPAVHPSNKLYVVFTSGSTGKPKGAIITHANFSSAISYHTKALGFSARSRVYDFVSYAFDVAWSNLLHSLAVGACLCIPSQEGRQENISKSMRDLRINYADLTPSITRLFEASDVPALQHISFSGEEVLDNDFHRWKDLRSVLNTYGPAECTVKTTIHDMTASDSVSAKTIGYGVGANTWLVDTDTGTSLVPIGCTGEIWLEGPVVGLGYLGDPEKTSAAFVEDPPWLLQGGPRHSGRHGRLYKTGDLARYQTDGSLLFLGRKDTQVKINGQRVELGDVEHHLRSFFAGDVMVIAEVIKPKHSEYSLLVAFVGTNRARDSDKSVAHKAINTVTSSNDFVRELGKRVPAYMIPVTYIPIGSVPMTVTGKTDRKKLRDMGGGFTHEQLITLHTTRGPMHAPSTATERRLQQLWASILCLPKASIGANDNFFRLGGDSMAAMRLVALARSQGLVLTVADMFKYPQLHLLAEMVERGVFEQQSGESEPVRPFSLLSEPIDEHDVRSSVAALCGLEASQIDDAFPCTPLQEGLLALSSKQKSAYVGRSVLELKPEVDLDRFQSAWEEITRTTQILRTRIVDLPGQGLIQAVVNAKVQWQSDSVVGDLPANSASLTMGSPLVQPALAGADGKHFFILTIHHALYDGWSLRLILKSLSHTYRHNMTERLHLASFQPFIKHVLASSGAAAVEF